MVWQALQPGSSGVQQFIQRASPSEAARNRRLGIHDYEAYFDHRQSPSEMNNDDHHSITFRSPSPQSTTATPEPEFGPSSTDPDSDARFSYNPWSPAYSPSSPAYSPPSPAYSPSLPAYSPSSPPDPRSTWFTVFYTLWCSLYRNNYRVIWRGQLTTLFISRRLVYRRGQHLLLCHHVVKRLFL